MNPPNLSDLQAFAAVARHRSFRRAAEELDVSPSALSHTLSKLERQLGVRLLQRTTRSVSPTEAGLKLLSKLSPALSEVAIALDEINAFRDRPTGLLRINAPRIACETILAPIVARFIAAYPDMQVEITDDDSFVDIVADGYDAGVRFGESIQQDMVALPIGPAQRFVVVASPKLLERRPPPLNPRDLPEHPCIRIRFNNGVYYRWEFAKGTEKLDVEVAGPLIARNMRLMLAAAVDAVGYAYVYEHLARPWLDDGRLVRVLEDWCPVIPGFHLYYPSRRYMTAGLRAFIDISRTPSDPALPA